MSIALEPSGRITHSDLHPIGSSVEDVFVVLPLAIRTALDKLSAAESKATSRARNNVQLELRNKGAQASSARPIRYPRNSIKSLRHLLHQTGDSELHFALMYRDQPFDIFREISGPGSVADAARAKPEGSPKGTDTRLAHIEPISETQEPAEDTPRKVTRQAAARVAPAQAEAQPSPAGPAFRSPSVATLTTRPAWEDRGAQATAAEALVKLGNEPPLSRGRAHLSSPAQPRAGLGADNLRSAQQRSPATRKVRSYRV